MRYANRNAVVTGAGQGIGKAIAERLASEGASVFLIDVNPESLRKTVQAMSAQGFTVQSAVADVGNPRAVEAARDRFAEHASRCHFLVNNAGIFLRHGVEETPDEVWVRTLNTNLSGAFYCIKRFLPLMAEGDAIVNISSGRALAGAARGSAYAASKAGILGLTKSVAQELAHRGIRVNAVVPGITDTAQPRQEKSDAEMAEAGARIPLGRIGQPPDVAAAVAYLLSDDAAFVTGHTLVVNGGAIMV